MRPAPIPDPITEPFWAAARQGELLIQRCDDCDRWIHYPRAVCPQCLSTNLTFAPVSGRGSVYSFTWAHRPGGRAFAGQTPYAIVIVELEEGVRLMTAIPEASHDSLVVGAGVHVAGFEPTEDDGPPVVVFALDS